MSDQSDDDIDGYQLLVIVLIMISSVYRCLRFDRDVIGYIVNYIMIYAFTFRLKIIIILILWDVKYM